MRDNLPCRSCRIFLALLVLSIGCLARVDAEDSGSRIYRMRVAPGAAARNKNGVAVQGGETVEVLAERQLDELPPRERSGALSEQHIVVVGLDAHGNEQWRRTQIDPRLVRVEGGALTGTQDLGSLHFTPEATFSLMAPDVAGIKRLRIYKPRWTGTQFDLELLAETTVGADDR